ncbi:MAG TPA: hypothetical protein VFV49_04045 [Thermoanaerobaculia bacterium]|nr:hypothetical protein [Thermoanaerobaculia bacterium]
MTVTENPPAKRTFRWPADYYSSATPKPVLPQWAPFGCGAAAVVVLILVFAGGAMLSSGGFTDFMDFAIGMSVTEMKGQFTADVSAVQKKSLDDEIKQMSKNLREQKISIQAMQPFLQRLRDVTSDSKVTATEAAALQAVARKINSGAKR